MMTDMLVVLPISDIFYPWGVKAFPSLPIKCLRYHGRLCTNPFTTK